MSWAVKTDRVRLRPGQAVLARFGAREREKGGGPQRRLQFEVLAVMPPGLTEDGQTLARSCQVRAKLRMQDTDLGKVEDQCGDWHACGA